MASNATVAYGTDICLALAVEVTKDFFDVDKLSIGLAFLIGFIVGCLIALLCSRICARDCAKRKYQDEENVVMVTHGIAPHQKSKLEIDSGKEETKKKQRRSKNKARPGTSKKVTINEEVTIAEIPLISLGRLEDDDSVPPGIDGLVDAMMQTNSYGMEAELSRQDLNSAMNLEKELREESIMTMMQLVRTMLNKMLAKGKLSEDQYRDLVKEMQEGVTSNIQEIQQQQQAEEDQLRNDPKLSQDQDALEGAIENLQAKYTFLLNRNMKETKDQLRHKLDTTTELTDNEIDLIMADLANNMAELEKKLSAERSRQQQTLDEKLAHRRHLAAMRLHDKDKQLQEVDYRRDVHDKMLQSLVSDGKLQDRQKEELLEQYEGDLNRVQMQHDESLQRQQLSLADKLRLRREEQNRRLNEQQEQDKEDFLKHAEGVTDPTQVMEAYHDLLQQQRLQKEAMSDELDDQEAEELNRLKKEADEERKAQIAQQEQELEAQIQAKAQLSEREVEKLMRIHQQEMDEYERLKKSEKKRMRAMMEEKLAQRRLKAEEERLRSDTEQEALRVQQDSTIKKMLDTQVELDDKSKEKIMKEHHQNMAAINNQLQMSKIRQQKQLEQKLARRQAKTGDLRKQLADSQRQKRDGKQKKKKKKQKAASATLR